MTGLPFVMYFNFLSCGLRDLIMKLNNQINVEDQRFLISINEDIIDDILYIQDILSLKIAKINYCLINCVFYYIIMPVCIYSLITQNEVIFIF